jgi:hypothetical protein
MRDELPQRGFELLREPALAEADVAGINTLEVEPLKMADESAVLTAAWFAESADALGPQPRAQRQDWREGGRIMLAFATFELTIRAFAHNWSPFFLGSEPRERYASARRLRGSGEMTAPRHRTGITERSESLCELGPGLR